MDIEQRIASLEQIWSPDLPGTILSRIMLDNSVAWEAGLEPCTERRFQWAWCLALGRLQEHKQFFYGGTIEAALTAAENHDKRSERGPLS